MFVGKEGGGGPRLFPEILIFQGGIRNTRNHYYIPTVLTIIFCVSSPTSFAMDVYRKIEK